MAEFSRRGLLGALAAAGLPVAAASTAQAQAQGQASDAVTIGWPSDVPAWDPNQRFVPDAQPIFKMVYDQPLDQDSRLNLVPSLIRAWKMAPDARGLEVELRDDVVFHDGSKFTSADFRWTFFERIKAGHKVDIAQSWRKLVDIEAPTPTRAIMRFDSPAPTAPVWLAFLGSYVVPKAYMEKVGLEGFNAKPVGTGPYRLAEYQMNARIVLERNDQYWGPKPALRRVTVEIIKDTSARVAAVQSGKVDLTISVPVREVARLGNMAALAAELNPITRVILLQVRNDEGFADRNIRLAAHHAIDKKALSQAFYGGAAVPLSVPATPGSPGYLGDFTFPNDPNLSIQLLEKSGYSAQKPAKIRMATTNGQFPGDYDIARAIVAMWKKVGIEAELEVIEYAKYFELNRANKLPEATLYSFDNATGDPEIYAGYLLNPKLPFSPWKDMTLGQKVIDLFNVPGEAERIAGWRALNREAVETGACMPLLQSVQTLVRKKALSYRSYGNGWVLPQTMDWI
jgi:peptide/nickel transport system substrate-binding protein